MELKKQQSAIILEVDENCEVTVDVASGDHDGLTAKLCQAIALKVMEDEEFQAELASMIED